MMHFGVNIRQSKYALKLNREEFAVINQTPSLPKFQSLVESNAYDKSGKKYRLEWCEEYRKLCLQNFDLNMKFFSMLDKESFRRAITLFLQKYRGFKPVEDLSRYSEVEGYYLMVLDEYKQAYIGKTKDIKRRIMQHWSRNKPLDRILLPMYAVESSCLSIDCFRALDTTRIFAWKRNEADRVEARLITSFPKEFLCNRIGGDVTDLISAVATLNSRKL